MKPSRSFAVLLLIIAFLWGLVLYRGTYTPKLGLDLQGGMTLTLEATTSGGKAPDQDKLQEARDIIANRVNDTGVAEAEVQIEGDRNIVVNVPGTNDEDLKKVGEAAELRFRQVLETTPNVPAAKAKPSPTPSASASGSPKPSSSGNPIGDGTSKPSASGSASGAASPSPSDTDKTTAELLKSAYTKVGNGDPKKGQQLVAQIPQGITDPQKIAEDPQAMAFLAPFGKLTPEEVAVLPAEVQYKTPTITCKQLNARPPGSVRDPNAKVATCDTDGQTKYLLDVAKVLGTDVNKADYTFDPTRSMWIVTLDFTSRGQDKWTNLTAETVGKQVAVVMDNEVVSAPQIQERIAGNAEITGSFTQAEAKNLAAQLKFGALPVTFKLQNAYSITPTLGLDQLEAGLLAGLIGVVLVIIYSFIYYRALGIVVISSLLASAGIVYPSVVLLGQLLGFTLTLAGVAGFIVAIGVTADSFVVFFERLKDEVKDGRTVRSAVPRAWARARRTILSADTVSLLAAAVLYILALGPVQGFAFALGLSTVIDLLIVFLFTYPLVTLLSRSRTFTSPRISGLGNLRSDPRSAEATRVRGAVRTKES
jgi:preprotein translocase subunit SecD